MITSDQQQKERIDRDQERFVAPDRALPTIKDPIYGKGPCSTAMNGFCSPSQSGCFVVDPRHRLKTPMGTAPELMNMRARIVVHSAATRARSLTRHS
jgi:hypothetical protein